MMDWVRSEKTQRVFDNLEYRAKKYGLNNGQMRVWHGLVKWFDVHPEGPTKRELAELTGLSIGMVYWTLPVLEALEYITVNRKRNGRMISRSIRLWVYPEDIVKVG